VARISYQHHASAGLHVLGRQHLARDLGADAGHVAEHQPDDGSGIRIHEGRLFSKPAVS